LQLKYRFEGFETHTRQRPLRPATAHGPELFKAAWEELEAVLASDPRRLRLVGISATALAGEDPGQEELFGHKRDKLRKLDAAVDAIRDKHGDESMKRANQSFKA
jgi:DNA polymerase-4